MQKRGLTSDSRHFGPSGKTRWLIGALAALMPLCLYVSQSWAVSGPGSAPIYNPASKSYFQLLTSNLTHTRWADVKKEAEAKVFKGVRGRLAVVDNAETHNFIMKHFDVSHPMWIGLRYWCEFRLLQWVGLRPYAPSDPGHFQAWHPQWLRGAQICPPNARGADAFGGVYYQPLSKTTALWQLVGYGKGFSRLLVEFPTGGE